MTNEDWTQLAQQLNPDEKDKLFRIFCGPEEEWDEVDREIVLRLYGVDPKPIPYSRKKSSVILFAKNAAGVRRQNKNYSA